MLNDYSNQNLQKASFKNVDLTSSRFSDSDLRGADFTGSNLTDTEFTNVKTGIPPSSTRLIFLVALAVSVLSGYVAMLAGKTVQIMLASIDANVRAAGIITLVMVVAFIAYSYWKGLGIAIRQLILPVVLIALVIGLVAYVTGLGTGKGALYLILSLLLVVVMFFVGTVARAAAGSLSNILFIIVALSGGVFGRSVGGGIGTVIMAISCALISKRALSGAKGFESLRKIACFITTKFGTSFRNAKLAYANFSQSTIRNADFSDADVSGVNWNKSRKVNCHINEKIIIEKKEARSEEVK